MYILCCSQDSRVTYGTLYIHSFPLCVPRKILEADRFIRRYHSYAEIQNIPDRLRWLRHSRGLTQTELAQRTEIHDSVYKAIEAGAAQRIPQEAVERLAQFYSVPVTDFLDEFNRFLYDGQAKRILAYRGKLGMGRKTFARHTGIPLSSLRCWEENRKVVSRKCWEMYFKGRA